jgi:hypothetical protein
MPPNHWIVMTRTLLWVFLAIPACREFYQVDQRRQTKRRKLKRLFEVQVSDEHTARRFCQDRLGTNSEGIPI